LGPIFGPPGGLGYLVTGIFGRKADHDFLQREWGDRLLGRFFPLWGGTVIRALLGGRALLGYLAGEVYLSRRGVSWSSFFFPRPCTLRFCRNDFPGGVMFAVIMHFH